MAPQVDSMVPGGGTGPNQAEQQGMAQQFAAASHAIKSVGAPPMLDQGGAPAPPETPAGPPGPTQPVAQPDLAPGATDRFDFQFDPNIARRMEGSAPWRQFLLHIADNDPNSNAQWHAVADRIRSQTVTPE